MWKKWLFPLLYGVLALIDLGQLAVRLSQPDGNSLLGHGLMTLFWLALAVLIFRGSSGQKRRHEDEDEPEH